jgi:hypothetical protein
METTDFAAEYQTKADEELLRINFDADKLTYEASLALSAELRARGLDKPEVIESFRKEEDARRKEEEERYAAAVFVDGKKIGRERFGKANYQFDPETRMETFTTTAFFVVFYLPLVPIATYRVRKKKGWLQSDYEMLEKLPLDWDQILTVWVVTAVVLLAALWTLKFVLPRLLVR